ncbi:MAG: helix-turn-helix domain-containing protein, partial [Candidatus Thermoplasmatota archaeon]|nr:helix-turn-helix domain-containing protein [Candidatus Thermoplasmatota archaeon]
MNEIKKVENNVKNVLNHWGFEELSSSIYTALAISGKPLTAREISKHIDYAYSTTINALNNLIKLGYIQKMRDGRKNVYAANTDFVDIIHGERNRLFSLLRETSDEIHKLKSSYKRKLGGVLKMIENAIHYLEKTKKFEE